MSKELVEEIKSAFLKEDRLMQRLSSLFCEFNDFELDELFTNEDEQDEIKRKLLKINEKLIGSISKTLQKELNIIDVVPEDSKVDLEIGINDENEDKSTLKFSIFVEEDGFVIESEQDIEEESCSEDES